MSEVILRRKTISILPFQWFEYMIKESSHFEKEKKHLDEYIIGARSGNVSKKTHLSCFQNGVCMNNAYKSLNFDVKNTYRLESDLYVFIYIQTSIRSISMHEKSIEQFASLSPMWLFSVALFSSLCLSWARSSFLTKYRKRK